MKLTKRKKLGLGGIALLAIITTIIFSFPEMGLNLSTSAVLAEKSATESSLSKPITVENPTIKYGFVLDNFKVTEGEFQKNEVLGAVLQRHNVPYTQIDKLVKVATNIFDVRKMRVGKSYTILTSEDGKAADYLIYEPTPFFYVVYDLRGETSVKIVERPIELKKKENAGVVTASLWNAIVDNGMSYEIAAKMEAALAWQVDFHHIVKGDCFKLIYDEQYIDGKLVGVGNIKAAYFKNKGKEFNAYYYEDENYTGFFDDEGRPMKKAFLKSPVQYARISSAYNLKRFHPILRRVKAHLGTDYAAPYGTPIQAVASGTVTKAGRTRGNGNYVKIRHDNTYETQYLHMQKFAKGMRSGVRVNQGEVIGYVGSTGLATGPHVCFRFWKNGKQVDHRRENLPPPNPMEGESLEAFKKMQTELAARLALIDFPSEEDGVKSKEEQKVIDP
ncbi:MAG: peptidoglycan DD-metalloendopeptidase family protein [Saprospiraceae bacterium]|nr:peptidoglycan DD-metalloendopeptidase family protein [Saprospiraceae bacterium]